MISITNCFNICFAVFFWRQIAIFVYIKEIANSDEVVNSFPSDHESFSQRTKLH